ncbi:MAG: hypothetical protein LJE64_03815 [Desulfofustis sp.]|nr:hypothetical protein [Desulfofustis sp.]
MNRFQKIFPRINRNPLTYRTLGYVLLCTTAFAVLSTAIQLYVEYRRDIANLNENIELIEKSYLPSISASVYKVDTDALMLQLDGALKLSDIVYLKVDEQRGNTLIETSAGNLDATNLISHEYQLIYSDPSTAPRSLGSLTVYASLNGVYQRLLSRVFTVLATNTVKTFLASAGILAIMYWLITRHLIQISDYTRKLLPGKQDSRLTLHRKPPASSKEDELDQLVVSINAFQDRLREDGARREAYEERLRQAEQKYRTVALFHGSSIFHGKITAGAPCTRLSSRNLLSQKQVFTIFYPDFYRLESIL